jgi:hypothetical protein
MHWDDEGKTLEIAPVERKQVPNTMHLGAPPKMGIVNLRAAHLVCE